MIIESVHYTLQDQVAKIRNDDGKRNALSPQVLREIDQALDRAESDRAIVVMTGRESVFSAGFDLHVMQRGGVNALRMLRAGYSLTARVMAYPYPVIAACNGHALVMGSNCFFGCRRSSYCGLFEIAVRALMWAPPSRLRRRIMKTAPGSISRRDLLVGSAALGGFV